MNAGSASSNPGSRAVGRGTDTQIFAMVYTVNIDLFKFSFVVKL